jgi:hypothetical protein
MNDLDKIKQLESTRLEIGRLQKAIGSAGDFLDRGRPGPEDKANAETFIRENKPKVQAMEAEFKATLQSYRADQPSVLAGWVQTHLDTLTEIISETEAAGKLDISAKTRIHVAKKSIAEWEEVLAGKRVYVTVNTSHLKDYYIRLAPRLPDVEFPKK